MNIKTKYTIPYSKPLRIYIGVGILLTITTLSSMLISCEENSYPKPPTIITVPSLPEDTRAQINKDILFEKAFKRFGECMEDANKTTAEDCKKEFWSSGYEH